MMIAKSGFRRERTLFESLIGQGVADVAPLDERGLSISAPKLVGNYIPVDLVQSAGQPEFDRPPDLVDVRRTTLHVLEPDLPPPPTRADSVLVGCAWPTVYPDPASLPPTRRSKRG
jgi:hypothetical protein